MKINISYDTKTKALKFTKDGEVVENLESLSLYKRYTEDGSNKYSLDFSELSVEDDKKEGTRKVVRENTMASLQEALTQGFPKRNK